MIELRKIPVILSDGSVAFDVGIAAVDQDNQIFLCATSERDADAFIGAFAELVNAHTTESHKVL